MWQEKSFFQKLIIWAINFPLLWKWVTYACFGFPRLFTFHHDCLFKCFMHLSSFVCVLHLPTVFHFYHLVIFVELFELYSSSLDNIPCRLVENVFLSLRCRHPQRHVLTHSYFMSFPTVIRFLCLVLLNEVSSTENTIRNQKEWFSLLSKKTDIHDLFNLEDE